MIAIDHFSFAAKGNQKIVLHHSIFAVCPVNSGISQTFCCNTPSTCGAASLARMWWRSFFAVSLQNRRIRSESKETNRSDAWSTASLDDSEFDFCRFLFTPAATMFGISRNSLIWAWFSVFRPKVALVRRARRRLGAVTHFRRMFYRC